MECCKIINNHKGEVEKMVDKAKKNRGEFVKKQQCKKSTRVCKLNHFSGSHLWKLNGSMLQNKAKIWKSDEKWVFKYKTDLIYIENISTKKVLGSTKDGKVSPENYEEGKAEQLWKKGELDAEEYFTLENYGAPGVLNAISETGLEIKGNITLR